jgi:hypothetical protein
MRRGEESEAGCLQNSWVLILRYSFPRLRGVGFFQRFFGGIALLDWGAWFSATPAFSITTLLAISVVLCAVSE